MNVWPATLPRRSTVDGFSREFGDARRKVPTDAGPGKTARRFSYMPDPFTATMVMTQEQKVIFETFVKTALKGGTLPFEFPDQEAEEVGVWVVRLGQTMPRWQKHSRYTWIVAMELLLLSDKS